ncbi:MAG: leucine-rich repeat domain-containing protein [Flammeovirgaceae bacterium]
MNCPVCNTTVADDAIHCGTCNWYIPLKDTEHYQVELSRAKQQWQMVSSFNQVFQHLQVQNQVLEKVSFRLDGLENEMTAIKEKGLIPTITPFQQKYEYPPLAPIQAAEDFDTPEKRKAWWDNLEEQWQNAFNKGFFQKELDHQPTDEEIEDLLTIPTIRLVGPRGMYPNLDFELTNLSGIKHLTNLTTLVVTHLALTSLEGIEHLTNLTHLFVVGNKIQNIKEVHYLTNLVQLYCNVNQIVDIHPVEGLTKLDTLYCCYNRLTSLEGLTAAHTENLKEFVCLPNDDVKPKEIKRVEEELEITCKKG